MQGKRYPRSGQKQHAARRPQQQRLRTWAAKQIQPQRSPCKASGKRHNLCAERLEQDFLRRVLRNPNDYSQHAQKDRSHLNTPADALRASHRKNSSCRDARGDGAQAERTTRRRRSPGRLQPSNKFANKLASLTLKKTRGSGQSNPRDIVRGKETITRTENRNFSNFVYHTENR